MTERDWEASARQRMTRLVGTIVERIREVADEIEREAERNIANAAKGKRGLALQTYPRAAGEVVHMIQNLVSNLPLDSVIDAAADAEQAWAEKQTKPDTTLIAEKAAKSAALYAMLLTLDGWIEGAQSNHEALEHRGENTGQECWRQFAPSDIRNMVNDAAREMNLTEFPIPATPREDAR